MDVTFLFETQRVIRGAALGARGARSVARVVSGAEGVVRPDASWELFTFFLCEREKGAEALELRTTIAHCFGFCWVLRIIWCEFDHKILASFLIVSKYSSLIIDRKYSHLKIVPSINHRRKKKHLRIVSDTNTSY